MGAAFSDTVRVPQHVIVDLHTGLNALTTICCIAVVLIHILSEKECFDGIVRFFNKIFPDPVRKILLCHLSINGNQAQISSTPISLYQFNDHLTYIKPARRFYLLIFPMQLYVMFLIFESKIINEQETSIHEINLTVSFEEQRKFYRCSNDTDMCTSYMFKTENVIDTVTNLISWWMGLSLVINKLIFLLHQEVMKIHRSENRCMSLQSKIRLYRYVGRLVPLLFIAYTVTDIRTDIGSTWFPLVLALILVCGAGLSAAADLYQQYQEWPILDSEKQRLVAHEKQLNTNRPVLILEEAQPERILVTNGHHSELAVPTLTQEQKWAKKVTPLTSKNSKF